MRPNCRRKSKRANIIPTNKCMPCRAKLSIKLQNNPEIDFCFSVLDRFIPLFYPKYFRFKNQLKGMTTESHSKRNRIGTNILAFLM